MNFVVYQKVFFTLETYRKRKGEGRGEGEEENEEGGGRERGEAGKEGEERKEGRREIAEAPLSLWRMPSLGVGPQLLWLFSDHKKKKEKSCEFGKQ